MPTYIVSYCKYVRASGDAPAALFLKIEQEIDGKSWSKLLSLSGDEAQTLWDQYTAGTEQSTIQALLAQE